MENKKSCKSCAKYRFCDEKETEVENCKKWIKRPYMYLKEHDGYKWEFERID